MVVRALTKYDDNGYHDAADDDYDRDNDNRCMV